MLVTFDNYITDGSPDSQTIVLSGGESALGKGSSPDIPGSVPEWAYNNFNYCLTLSPKHKYKDMGDYKKQCRMLKKALENTLVMFPEVKIYGNLEFYGDNKNIHFHGVVYNLKYTQLSKFKQRLWKMVMGSEKEKRKPYQPLIDMDKPYKCITNYLKYCSKHKDFMSKFDISPILLEHSKFI